MRCVGRDEAICLVIEAPYRCSEPAPMATSTAGLDRGDQAELSKWTASPPEGASCTRKARKRMAFTARRVATETARSEVRCDWRTSFGGRYGARPSRRRLPHSCLPSKPLGHLQCR